MKKFTELDYDFCDSVCLLGIGLIQKYNLHDDCMYIENLNLWKKEHRLVARLIKIIMENQTGLTLYSNAKGMLLHLQNQYFGRKMKLTPPHHHSVLNGRTIVNRLKILCIKYNKQNHKNITPKKIYKEYYQ